MSPPAGWSVESLQEWGVYMKLAIPSMFMICFEWWIYEFGGFFAGVFMSRPKKKKQFDLSV